MDGIFTTKSGVGLPIIPVSEVDLVPVFTKATGTMPEPPTIIVEGKEIKNEADPAYLKAKQDFGTGAGFDTMAVYIEYGVDIDLTPEQLKRVKRLQAQRESVNPGKASNRYNIYTYVTTLCPEMEELFKLMTAIEALSKPTMEQVQQHEATFRPGVQGAADNVDQDPGQRSLVPIG